MEQNPSSKANRSSASQEIPQILWNLKVHDRIYNSPPPVLTLQHTLKTNFKVSLTVTPKSSKQSATFRLHDKHFT
jgi:hypothetical protein